MVDLMMWLVIAALLLAAAIQGMGYYQKAAYLYHMKSDLDGVGSLANAKASQNDGAINNAIVTESVADGKWSKEVIPSVEGGNDPYIRASHPGVTDLDVLYLFDSCGDNYKIGVNVVPKGGNPTLIECGISAAPPAGGSGTPTAGDIDGDGIPNATDPDIDGDGVPNAEDPAPNDPAVPGGTTPLVDYSFSGKLAAWGANNWGQLGNGTTSWATGSYVENMSDTPTNTLLAGKNITAFDASLTSTCAVADGELYCWGSNQHGMIAGYPSGVDENRKERLYGTPMKISGFEGKSVTQLAVGIYQSCAIADARAYCWGANNSGQLGNGTVDPDWDNENHYGPAPVAGALAGADVSFIAVSSSNQQACAISAGDVYCWGDNYWNGLGTGTATTTNNGAEPLPIKMAGDLAGKKATYVTKGYYDQTCAIADGVPYCWGENDYAYFPIAADEVPVPTVWDMSSLPAGSVVTDISIGENHACAIVSEKAYCWSSMSTWYDLGQTGQGTKGIGGSGIPSPVVTAGTPMEGKTVTGIAAGQNSTCAAAGGDLYCWGGSREGQRGLFTNVDSGVPALVEKGNVSGTTVSEVVDGWDTFFALYN